GRVLPFRQGETDHPVSVRRDGTGWAITAAGTTLAGTGVLADGRLVLRLDGVVERAGFVRDGARITLRWRGETLVLALPDPTTAAEAEEATEGGLRAPLPGTVAAVHVAAGARVVRGAVLVVMEAMKTVFRLTAPADAVVAGLDCRVGDAVAEGQVLVRFAGEEATG
ncbi:MAG: acetyl-CoA carboxylase biotin carboxyl carrier protein subunit, partial [Acetobacteraceae bacterium]